MIGGQGPQLTIHGFGENSSITRQQIKPGTVRRVIPYAKPYRWRIIILLFITALDAVITVATPLLFQELLNNGVVPRDAGVVIACAITVAGLALLQALVQTTESYFSGGISEGLIYDLRAQLFRHVQRQPLAFFTRAQTGSLVSRLNTDVVGAQQAISTLLSQVVSSILSLVLVLITMFYLSWQISLVALIILPFFVLPGRIIGRRMQRLMRESMQLNAEMGSLMNERFNVAGALLSKLYGRPREEDHLFADSASRVRDIGVVNTVYMRMLMIAVTLVASLATAIVYGVGGRLVIDNDLQIGTLVAMALLLTRLFGPINQLSTMQANVMTALVSFDRLFEVLDLKPLIAEVPDARPLPVSSGSNGRSGSNGTAPELEFDQVSFRYPTAADVSLASLESIALQTPERTDNAWALRDVSFCAPAGKLTALVGPSGAGKTTMTYLVPRLYDPGSGAVRIGGLDLRDATLDSVSATVGMVTQDTHLYHDTIRSNLMYARPGATEKELVEACRAAQIWDLISSLSNGFDTVVGDRGYRLSGGEKQRIAIARLLLKAPSVVVLDEATAHLDSESEAAIQRALKTALVGRTSLVIAHRLSTIREADQILVVDEGQIKERGVHAELLAAGGLYAELYRTQFSRQPVDGNHSPSEPLVQRVGAPGDDDEFPFAHMGPPPGPPGAATSPAVHVLRPRDQVAGDDRVPPPTPPPPPPR